MFIIAYGRVGEIVPEIITLTVDSVKEVKSLATKFITVIPDDLEDYTQEIINWNGEEELLLTHQDDDTFIFRCLPLSLTKDFNSFNEFVKEFQVEDE